jgi:hypothetical protein
MGLTVTLTCSSFLSLVAKSSVADGKAVLGNDESDDDLHAVGKYVATVSENF